MQMMIQMKDVIVTLRSVIQAAFLSLYALLIAKYLRIQSGLYEEFIFDFYYSFFFIDRNLDTYFLTFNELNVKRKSHII